MAITINSNTIASQASLNVSRASNLLAKSLSRLSSGRRIVSPADDAGGLAVGMKLESALKRTAATKYNIQNGVSYLQVQDGALKVTGSILDRMSELKSFYNDISKNEDDRENYNYEFTELQKQLVEIKAAKFNGVSLFATLEPDNNPMQIITTEDGVTGKVELSRTGLFENLKSKYGADSVLDTGANGTYRQFVGEYTIDGINQVTGTESANATSGAGAAVAAQTGYITQDYEAGDIVNFNGVYFQVHEKGKDITQVTDNQGNVTNVLKYDPSSLIKIESTAADANKNFIPIADLNNVLGTASAQPFAEAYQNADEYSAFKLQYKGTNAIGYEPGDTIKVKITDDVDGPGYRYYKVNESATTVLANGGTTAGDFATSQGLNEWIEVGQAASTTNAAAGFRIMSPSRANGTVNVDGDLLTGATGTGIDGETIQQGDKLYYQGDYYMYISLNNSASFDDYNKAPGDTDGYTYMEDLINAGAAIKLNGYVDEIPRGGSPDADPNAFFDANTELKFIDRLPNSGLVRTNTIVRSKNPSGSDEAFRSVDDHYYKGLHAGNDGIYGTTDDYYQTTSSKDIAKKGYHVDADADNNKDLLATEYDLSNFSVADFVDYIQTLANFRAVNGGTMSRLNYSEELLDENAMNLEAATSRIVDADMALESTKFARQNVLVQAGAAMVVQANQLSNIVLALLA